MEDYIKKFHTEEISNILKSKNPVVTVNFDLANLFKENVKLFDQLKYCFDEEYEKWKKAAIAQISQIVQRDKIQLTNKRMDISFEFHNHPKQIEWPKITKDLFQLIEFKGYVFRSSAPKKLEMIREVMCMKCKQKTTIKADRQFDYAFKCSRKCIIKDDCEGKMVYTKKQEEIPPLENTIDFQVFKVQELDKFTPKNRFCSVECEGKLVDACSIGDTVYILGTFETRNDLQTKEIKRVVIRAITITKAFEFKQSMNSDEKEATYSAWIADKRRHNNNEQAARDEMCSGVAPEINGCFILKLSLLIVLCTGGRSKQSQKNHTQRLERMTNRDISHLLLIGLPGLGKSQLLRAASKISNRAIKCVGSACTLPGLTASSYKEDKENHVEAGALVLANHGICCIDEFNLLSTRNRGALHDAMEHQKFSFMQANLKVEVNARCSVIGSMNHKAEQMAEARNKNIKNSAFNIEPSLISRFDFVFFLDKPENAEFDENIVASIIGESRSNHQEPTPHWSLERLQLHVIGAKNLTCLITEDVLKLLLNYYRFCCACEEVDESRKTMRLLKSVERLTIGHAKLMLRNKTKLIDALTVIWLYENSWSFGDLIEQTNVVMSDLPLGPSDKCIKHIFDTLLLSELYEVYEKEQMEIANDTICALEFNASVHEELNEKKEVKKLFNKTKRRSNEKKNSEKIDDGLSEELKKSFAISHINDLFDDSDEEVNGNNNVQKSPENHQTDSEDILTNDLIDMEDFIFNQMDNDFDGLNKNMMSTQIEQPTTSSKSATQKENLPKKSSLGNLLSNKNQSDENNKRRKLLDEEDLFAIFTDDLPPKDMQPHCSKNDPPRNSAKNNNTKSTLAFLGRLKTFEYSSQKTQSSEGGNNPKGTENGSITENLLALSNQFKPNRDENIANNSKFNMTMSKEEYLKALDDEMDLFN